MLYIQALGELEVRAGTSDRAREVFTAGINADGNCAGLYHAAALLEAKLGNMQVQRALDAGLSIAGSSYRAWLYLTLYLM